MKKMKNCLLVLLALCLMMTVLTACGENKTTGSTTTATQTTAGQTTTGSQEEPICYIFTVVYGDTEEPVEGVMVQLCRGETCLFPIATDAEGKVEYTHIANANYGYGEYEVHIIEDSLPEGYSFDNTSMKTNETDKEYTLVLVKNEA